ncbi:MAG: IS110 family transposase [Candidatus Paceibacterota bacterium]
MQLTKTKPNEYDVTIGIDTDTKSFAITHRDRQAKERSIKMPSDPDNLHNYFQKRFPNKRLLFAYEAGPTGYYLHDQLKARGQDCIMINPASIQKAPNEKVKTNRIDSRKIAEQVQGGQLKGIRIPTEQYRNLRHLVSLRQQYAKDQRRAKQRIKSLLLFEHIIVSQLEVENWSGHHIKTLRELKLREPVCFKLNLFLEDLDYAREHIAQVQRKMRAFVRENKYIRKNLSLLMSIPGFGFVVPLYLLARIGEHDGLKNPRELGALAGLVPTEDSTGDNINRGNITHMGDRILRGLLVEAAWAAIRKDKQLRQTYYRIKARNRGKKDGAKKIAIVAVARKLTERAYRVLKEQRPYVVY